MVLLRTTLFLLYDQEATVHPIQLEQASKTPRVLIPQQLLFMIFHGLYLAGDQLVLFPVNPTRPNQESQLPQERPPSASTQASYNENKFGWYHALHRIPNRFNLFVTSFRKQIYNVTCHHVTTSFNLGRTIPRTKSTGGRSSDIPGIYRLPSTGLDRY